MSLLCGTVPRFYFRNKCQETCRTCGDLATTFAEGMEVEAYSDGTPCPLECASCRSGLQARTKAGRAGGDALVDGVCHNYCARSKFCGHTEAYTANGVDCSGCKPTADGDDDGFPDGGQWLPGTVLKTEDGVADIKYADKLTLTGLVTGATDAKVKSVRPVEVRLVVEPYMHSLHKGIAVSSGSPLSLHLAGL